MGEFDTNPSEREEGKGRGFSYCYGGGKRGENWDDDKWEND